MNYKKTALVVLFNANGDVLSVSRKDNHYDKGIIGGKMDDTDESEEAAAIRETKEETGLDIFNLRLIFVMHKDGYMGYTYLADWTGELYTKEPHVLEWVPFIRVINESSYGAWNRLVSESLKSMGVKFRMFSW